MKKVLTILMAICLLLPAAAVAQNKALEKAMKKEKKEKMMQI